MTAASPGSYRVAPPRHRLIPVGSLVAVSLGGALGAPLRYGVGRAMTGTGWLPWSTVVVNLTGAFALGLLVVLVAERLPPTRYLRPFVGTGLLGAYTTYSTFAVEAVLLGRHDRVGAAAAYVAVTLVGGLLAALAGVVMARAVPGLSRTA